MKRTTAALACIALLAVVPATSAQEAEDTTVLSMNDVVLEHYRVENVDPDDLFQLAYEMVGRRIFLKENGGMRSGGVDSMRQLGSTIVLYDAREQVDRALKMLAKLDTDTVEERSSRSESRDYRPRFVSMETARDVARNHVGRSSTLDELGILQLHGTAQQLEAALAALEAVDVPERQVLLTIHMLEVGSEEGGPPLPEELVSNLRKLLPGSEFRHTAMAMLKTSVQRPQLTSVQIESSLVQRYRLSFVPTAYDEETASMTVSHCTLVQELDSGIRELFSTNTVLRGGEYTVLAATGAMPKLLVVRVTPLD